MAELARAAAKALHDYGAAAADAQQAQQQGGAGAGGAAVVLPELYVDGFDPEQIWLQVGAAPLSPLLYMFAICFWCEGSALSSDLPACLGPLSILFVLVKHTKGILLGAAFCAAVLRAQQIRSVTWS